MQHLTEDKEQRIRRLNALTNWERVLLVMYLDGRAPEYVDEWFERFGGTRRQPLPGR